MSGEYYCGTLNCGESFDKDSERLAHYVDRSHGPHEHPSSRYCFPCNLVYYTSILLETHRREEHCDTWCFTCSFDFTSYGELKGHMAKAHGTILPPPATPRASAQSAKTVKKPTKPTPKPHVLVQAARIEPTSPVTPTVSLGPVKPPTEEKPANQIEVGKGKGGAHTIMNRHIPCRVKGCEGMFKSPSGVAHHLESNTHEGIHRHTVTAVAQTMEIVPEISLNKRNALDASTITPLISYEADEASFNGQHFKCVLCPKKEFKSIDALHAHLNSPAHDADEFKCPKKGCGREFVLISALTQHIESETCGLTNIVEVQQWFDGLAAQFDRLLR